jgi:hypothetical protein
VIDYEVYDQCPNDTTPPYLSARRVSWLQMRASTSPKTRPQILPKGFHRIRHYGLLARSRTKADTLARVRELIDLARPVQKPRPQTNQDHAPAGTEAIDEPVHPCPCCGSPMVIIETFEADSTPPNRPTAFTTVVRIDTS